MSQTLLRRCALALFGLVASQIPLVAASAQTAVTARGDAATLDLASWNVEFFGDPTQGPGNDPVQLRFVKDVLRGSKIDVWALQEVVDETEYNALLDSLSGDGYVGILGPQVSTNPTFDQKLAFVYDPTVLTNVTSRTILASEDFNFAGRLPLELEATATVGGVSRDLRIITIHAKASGDAASRNRRTAASQALKTYTDNLLTQGIDVIVLGDFNDELAMSTAGGASPYANFVSSPDYRFATAGLESSNTATFCGSDNTCSGGSTIDHLLYSAGLFNGVVEGDRYGELTTEIPQYTQTTSDHLPVLARIDLAMAVNADDAPMSRPVALTVASPARGTSVVTVRLDAPADVTLDVFDIRGRRIARLAKQAFGAGTHTVPWNGVGLAGGLYLVRLQAGPHVVTRLAARVR